MNLRFEAEVLPMCFCLTPAHFHVIVHIFALPGSLQVVHSGILDLYEQKNKGIVLMSNSCFNATSSNTVKLNLFV
jgi:hypothetical protein